VSTTLPSPSTDQTAAGATRGDDIVFFDGTCGLCHASVRFILNHERATSRRPHFAPLFGETYDQLAKPILRDPVPDSVHVLTPDGHVLTRSRAVIHLCRGLGGGWLTLAAFASWFPTALLDLVYRVVAATRKRLWRKTESACPVVAAHLRDRFLP